MGVIRQIVTTSLDLVDRKNKVKGFRDYYFRDRWLRGLTNIVHVGANTGQEAARYADRGVGVLWIEPIPFAFAVLEKNIAQYPRQRACQALVTDKAGSPVTLNISTNEGQSSSIFAFARHKEIWPHVEYDGKLELVSQTLDDILSSDPRKYDGLVMDTQGAELLVLKGASKAMRGFRSIKTEAANCEIYEGAATDRDLINFLEPHGFAVVRRDEVFTGPNGAECFNLLFERIAS